MSLSAYDPTLCDLCGSSSHRIILDIPDLSMTSDDQITAQALRKIECLGCKLIRSALPVSINQLGEHYETRYRLGQRAALAEPMFFLEKNASPRSKVVFDWLVGCLSQAGFTNPRSVLEIGCGEGSLLEQFANHWRSARLHGVDISESSVNKAREKGLDAKKGSYRDVEGSYDLIYSFAVIEHIPSPSDFIAVLKSHLAPGGTLLISQPCQDHGSNDIFFSDHLWHFYSDHITKFGERQGLQESLRSTDSNAIPNFSVHVFQEGIARTEARNISTVRKIDETITKWTKIFKGIDKWLSERNDLKLVVWGIGQTFTLFCAYTTLKHFSISRAIEDNPQRFQGEDFKFPVSKFEPQVFQNDRNLRVLFTFRPKDRLIQTIREMSISYYSPFEQEL